MPTHTAQLDVYYRLGERILGVTQLWFDDHTEHRDCAIDLAKLIDRVAEPLAKPSLELIEVFSTLEINLDVQVHTTSCKDLMLLEMLSMTSKYKAAVLDKFNIYLDSSDSVAHINIALETNTTSKMEPKDCPRCEYGFASTWPFDKVCNKCGYPGLKDSK